MGRRKDDTKTFKRFVIGSSIAAGLGYVAGVLTAPKSGKQSRQELQKVASSRLQAAEKDLKNLHTELGDLLDDTKKQGGKTSKRTKEEAAELLERAKDTKEKVREMLSAIHEGGAEDKDLKKAIKDAKASVEHLRDYLKK
jgi:gas vesicle protein